MAATLRVVGAIERAERMGAVVQVTEVYVRCGFEADASVSSLQMLTNIEAKLEEYLVRPVLTHAVSEPE